MPKFFPSYFAPIGEIGEGLTEAAYLGLQGTVHKCLNWKTKHLATIKRIELNWSDPESHSTAISGIAFLEELKHSNIVTQVIKISSLSRLEQVFLGCDELYLIYEYLTLDLRRYMDLNYKDTALPPDTVKVWAYFGSYFK